MSAYLNRQDDCGFSGRNTDRPALKRLLADIESGSAECVVVYKGDRLNRSLLDFFKMREVFDKQNVSFVSVTQQFNTTHSMGRLTLKILPTVVRPVRTGNHFGAESEQDCRGAEERESEDAPV